MEKKERKQSKDSDQKKTEPFTINSLGELLPFIFFAFFFAFIIGSQTLHQSTVNINQISPERSSDMAVAQKQADLENREHLEEKVFLNTSPAKVKAKTLPIIEKTKDGQAKEEKFSTENTEDLARPILPKASPREALPRLEVSTPADKKSIPLEKYSSINIDEQTSIIETVEPVEEVILSERIIPTDFKKSSVVELLDNQGIARLEEVEMRLPEMTIKHEWKPKVELKEENLEKEALVEEQVKIEEETSQELDNPVSYNSSDFKWAINNHNSGIMKSAIFTNTPDGKASYSRTDAGIVLKVNKIANLNPSYGIFVEKSEDGLEYNTIGIINAENRSELYYFDAEYSVDGQHHYRFRSMNTGGNEVEFGKVSVVRRASVSPILSQVNAVGKYNLTLDAKSTEAIHYEIKEAWGSLNSEKGTKQLTEGENELAFDLAGDPGLYFLTMSTKNQTLELLIEKPGISPDLSFYNQNVSGKQSFGNSNQMPFFIQKPDALNFDFYLKNGNTLIFNKGEYNSEAVKIKKAEMGTLSESLQGRHSEEMLWFTASSNISYLHQKIPVILEHKEQEIAAQINIFASKNTIRPISHFSPNNDGSQDKWRIPGIKSCPNINLMVFNSWGNLIYQTQNVTEENIWNGQRNGENLPEGMYYYVLGQYGGWVQLER